MEFGYELPLFFTNPFERAVIGDLKLLQIEIGRRFRAESHRMVDPHYHLLQNCINPIPAKNGAAQVKSIFSHRA
jgi:hypothetical protein